MLVRNTLLNLLGFGTPFVAAVFAIPPLVLALGDDRFGLLTLLWAIVGYFGLFDFGIGRAITHDLSVLRATGREREAPEAIGTANGLLLLLGLVAGLLLYLLGPPLVNRMESVPDPEEVEAAIAALAMAMPFILLTAGFRGVLEANLQFGWVNALRAPYGVWTFLAPLAVVQLDGPRLDSIAVVLALGRVAFCLLHMLPIVRRLPVLLLKPSVSRSAAARLLSTGSWLAASNVVGPLMGYLDRFLVGAYTSAAAIAHYATPQEIVTKLLVIPAALTSVLFPAFSSRIAVRDAGARLLATRALKLVMVTMLPLCAGGAMFSHPILAAWISPEFADNSHLVMSTMLVGAFFNACATVPHTALQSAGHARAVAVLYVLELPGFFALYAWLVPAMGVTGGAIAWSTRGLVDCLILFALARRLVWQPLAAQPSRQVIR